MLVNFSSECVVYYVDESTGGLEISHNCVLSSKDYPGDPGAVGQVLWTPDGCALVAAWEKGGIAMWSTFGSLLMCSLGWDYGLNIDLQTNNPLQIKSMQFATEGYQLWMVHKEVTNTIENDEVNRNSNQTTSLLQLDFMKSALTINPCMVSIFVPNFKLISYTLNGNRFVPIAVQNGLQLYCTCAVTL